MSLNTQILILRYRPNQLKAKISPVFYCFAKPSTAYISGTNEPIFMRFYVKCGIKNANTTNYMYKKYFVVPGPLVSPAVAVCG